MLLLMVNKLTGSPFCTPELTGRAYMNQTTRVYCQRVAESCGICFGADRRGGRWRREWRSGRGWCGDGVFSTSSASYLTYSFWYRKVTERLQMICEHQKKLSEIFYKSFESAFSVILQPLLKVRFRKIRPLFGF